MREHFAPISIGVRDIAIQILNIGILLESKEDYKNRINKKSNNKRN